MPENTTVPPSRYCPACGAQLPVHARFCQKCGSRREAAPSAVTPPAQPSTPAPHPETPRAAAGVPGQSPADTAPAPAPAARAATAGTRGADGTQPTQLPPRPPAPPAQTTGNVLAGTGQQPVPQRQPRPGATQAAAAPAPPALMVERARETPGTSLDARGPAVSTPAGSPTGYQVALVSPGLYRPRVIMALRQVLGLNAAAANAFLAGAPAVLAVGLSFEMAERLRAALVGAGAVVQVNAPAPPPAAARTRPPKPDVQKNMEATTRVHREMRERRGARTVTGLALGRGYSYLSYARADRRRLLAPPDFVRFDARTMVPTAVKLAGGGSADLIGLAALEQWPQRPDEVRLGFSWEIGADQGDAVRAARSYLTMLSYRLVEVLGPGAIDPAEGSATALGVPPDWTDDRVRLLAETVEQAGFPLALLVPEPLAVVAFHIQKSPPETEHAMVVDLGAQGLGLSFVELGGDRSDPVVIDHVEMPLGGMWFDMVMEQHLTQMLQVDLSDEDQRALALFARDFKEEASRSFADGRSEHVQYCVIPAGDPPSRISITRAEMDEMLMDARKQLEQALSDAPARIGFERRHLDHVILAGGGARWYFVHEAVRAALDRDPIVAPHPEETIARGLVVSSVAQTSRTRR